MNPSSLAHPAHLAQISPGLTLPSWAVAVLVAIVTGVLGFAWRLAVKAERSADKLETAVERLTALESRIAVIAALEKADAVRELEVRHLREQIGVQAQELARLRDGLHDLRNEVHARGAT